MKKGSALVWVQCGTVAAVWLACVIGASSQITMNPTAMREHPAIAYSKTPADDAVARLERAVQSGAATLTFNPENGYLNAILDALKVPRESQVLVFSKTSFQAPKINPHNPRAIYFNDTVSVGWVRGGEVLEFVAQDPRQGAMFYTLDQKAEGPPTFTRNLVCIQCHTSSATMNVPGQFVGSVHPGPDGTVLYASAFDTDHRSPFQFRWGGWYVAGKHHLERHMGNATMPDPKNLTDMVTPATLNVTSIEGRFDMTGYAAHTSDIVALMVLEHQSHMMNAITRVGWEARLGEQAGRPLTDAAAELVDYMLFVDEEPLPGPIEGSSAFSKVFAAIGPRDSKGRSLRELALDRRMMRYPCSYLIYSEAFDALPAAAKEAVYARMWQILSGAEKDKRYTVLSTADREAVVEILSDTKKDLPEYFTVRPATGDGRLTASLAPR